MSEVCARCGHTSGGCQRCGRHDDDLGGNINGQNYCHNVDGTTCYMATSLVLASEPSDGDTMHVNLTNIPDDDRWVTLWSRNV